MLQKIIVGIPLSFPPSYLDMLADIDSSAVFVRYFIHGCFGDIYYIYYGNLCFLHTVSSLSYRVAEGIRVMLEL